MNIQDYNTLNLIYEGSVQKYDYTRFFPTPGIGTKQQNVDDQYEDVKSKVIQELKKIKNPNKRQVSFNIEKSFLGPFMRIVLVGNDLKLYSHGAGDNHPKELDFDKYFKNLNRGKQGGSSYQGNRLLIQLIKKIIKQQQRDLTD